MLKVKKEMQKALAKKDTKINENELRSLKEQIEKVRVGICVSSPNSWSMDYDNVVVKC